MWIYRKIVPLIEIKYVHKEAVIGVVIDSIMLSTFVSVINWAGVVSYYELPGIFTREMILNDPGCLEGNECVDI